MNNEISVIHTLIEKSVAQFGNRIALIEDDRQFTFTDLDLLSKKLAHQFVSLGLKKGDVIAIQLPNSWEFVIAHLAASRIGLVLNPLSPTYRKKELTYMLSHCETKALITPDYFKGFNYENLASELKEEIDHLEHIIIAGEPMNKDSVAFEQLLTEDAEKGALPFTPSKTDPALIMFTSGTESNPKAVLHTYESFVPAHLMNAKENQVSSYDKIVSLTPLAHMFSIPLVMVSMKFGATQYIVQNYQLDQVMELLVNENITYLTAAPAQLIDMVHYIRKNDIRDLKLRLIQTGGSKIPAQLVKDLRQLIGASIVSQWGMTEICAGTFTRPDDRESLAWETVGRATSAGEIIILNEDHERVPNGEVGEVAFKGTCLFKEYYKNEVATKEAFTDDGYFLTGDQGWIDDEGYLHFVGRKKDTINRGGLKFHASEIEEALSMHPKINQAAVVSVPDERLGERACAFISLRSDESIDLNEIKQFLLDKGFAKYKLPEFLRVKEKLPTTPSGKITKAPLRNEVDSIYS